MNLYKKNILKHVMPMNPRRHHKYLYIDANGNYVYPEDVAKKAGNKARDLNAQGQANAVNMRKARAESVKAGNSRMAAKLKSIYDQGQANNINARKARAESINAGNERVANSKAYKVGKTILEESTAGRKIKRFNKHANDLAGVVDDINVPKGNKVKPKRKTPEEIAREDAELERSISEKMSEFAAHEAEEYYKDQAKKKSEKLPKGWSRDQNGLVYDELGAIALDPNDPNLKKKKKRVKKNVAKAIRTSVAHSDTYRSNVMNSHQRMIYSSQLQHAERRNHKYLYKIGDRYIYPEDVKNGGHSSSSKFFGDSKLSKNEHQKGHGKVRQAQSDRQKAIDQGVKSANSKYWFSRGGMEAYLNSSHYKNSDEYKLDNARYKNSADYIGFKKKMEERDRKHERAAHPTTKTQQIEATQREQRRKTRQRKEIAKAHQGYTEDRKKFPEGGSTEELEKQKQKTAERKAIPGRQKDSARQSESERRSSSNLLRRESDALKKAKSDTAKRKLSNSKTAAEAERRLASEHDDNSVYWAKQRNRINNTVKKQDKNFYKVETKTVVNNPVKNKSVEVKDTSVKPITIKENTLKENVIRENTDKGFNKGLTMTERERFRRGYTVSKKPKKKKPTVKGSKKVTTWDNAKIKKW